MRKLSSDLAEPENDLTINSDVNVNLGIKLRQSGQFCRANELFLEAYRQDRKILQVKKLNFTLDNTFTDLKNAGKFFSEETLWKVAT